MDRQAEEALSDHPSPRLIRVPPAALNNNSVSQEPRPYNPLISDTAIATTSVVRAVPDSLDDKGRVVRPNNSPLISREGLRQGGSSDSPSELEEGPRRVSIVTPPGAPYQGGGLASLVLEGARPIRPGIEGRLAPGPGIAR